MVCIIDDREDVWKFAPNLITVKKYVYFQGIGDIHAPPAPREPPARKRGGWSPAAGSAPASVPSQLWLLLLQGSVWFCSVYFVSASERLGGLVCYTDTIWFQCNSISLSVFSW